MRLRPALFHLAPAMQDLTRVSREGKDVSAAGGLIVDAIDGIAGSVTEQQRADGAVADEENITRPIAREHFFGLANDARLRVDGALPAACAEIRPREELIGDLFELGWL